MSRQAQLIAAAEDDVSFLANSAKEERERWVIEHWCRLTNRTGPINRGPDPPDFFIGNELVEVVELLVEGRKRDREFKEVLADLKGGRRPPPRVASDLEDVLQEGTKWILLSVNRKEKKYGFRSVSWTLVIYVNVPFWERIDWSQIRVTLRHGSRSFARIDALSPDGTRIEPLYP